jgi:hypothetical protein
MPNIDLVEKDTDVAVTSSLPKVSIDFKNTDETTCENCHQPINGPFCAHCGQQAESTLKYFWVVIMHLLDDIFSFDSRASRTIWPLMIKPGFLTSEYIQGRRVHYVPPIRLYLFISIVFFLSLKFIAIGDGTVFKPEADSEIVSQLDKHINKIDQQYQQAVENKEKQEADAIQLTLTKFKNYKKDLIAADNLLFNEAIEDVLILELKKVAQTGGLTEKQQKRFLLFNDRLAKMKNAEVSSTPAFSISNQEDGTISLDFLSKENNNKLEKYVDALEKKATKAFSSDPTPLIKEAISKLPQLMFILLPIFALLLKIFYLFSKRLYLEHLTVALHSHSFIFFCILLLQLLDFGQSYLDKSFSFLSSIAAFLNTILLIWIPIYLLLMQKRIYKQGKFLTTIKYMLIGLSYSFLIIFTGITAFIWGLADS